MFCRLGHFCAKHLNWKLALASRRNHFKVNARIWQKGYSSHEETTVKSYGLLSSPLLNSPLHGTPSEITTRTTKSTTAEPITTSAPTRTNAPMTNNSPTSSTTQKHRDKPFKKFDGLSFVGGVVLTMGVLVMAFVTYKAKNERNYHTQQ